jgi:hypothetical protein
MAQYRVLQVAPSSWELDAAYEGGWRFVGRYNTSEEAQAKLAELVEAGSWRPARPTYYDGSGKAVVSEDNAPGAPE